MILSIPTALTTYRKIQYIMGGVCLFICIYLLFVCLFVCLFVYLFVLLGPSIVTDEDSIPIQCSMLTFI